MTNAATNTTDFLIDKADLHQTRFSEASTAPLGDGEVLLKVDRFAFTANNVTYAAFGDVMKYWQFFPATEGWGRIPVWGFADVAASNHPDVKVGERFYGYYPMSTHLVVAPSKVTPAGFSDGSPHRAELAVVYNYYNNAATDPAYREDMEDLQMIFRPLFMTSFLIDDFLADNDFFGAEQVVLSSASSKTAFGAAFQLAKRDGTHVIGLTSSGNIGFVESLGCYDKAVAYSDVASLDAAKKTIYIDMAGSGQVRTDVHTHFGENLVYSCAVGASHWDEMGDNSNLPGAKPTMFFAPSQGQKRLADWGPEGFQKNTAEAWLSFIKPAASWIEVEREAGPSMMLATYTDMVDSRVSPNIGKILSF